MTTSNEFLEMVSSDPWKLILAAMFLNKTAGKASIPIFWAVLDRWPTPEALAGG